MPHTAPVPSAPSNIPRLAFGGAVFGREIDEDTSRGLLDHAMARGMTLIDTAEAYGGGNARLARRQTLQVDDVREVSDEMHSSEKIIGRWLRARGGRSHLKICTKFNRGGRPEDIKMSLHDSLERLQTEYVDFYLFHRSFPAVPVRESLEALTDEVRAGRIRAIGCSNFTFAEVQEAQAVAHQCGLARIEAVQPAFNLANPSGRLDLLPWCAKEGIAVLTYSPLAAGFLSGKYSSAGVIPKGTRFDVSPGHTDVYFNARSFRILEQLRALSAELGQPMTHLAMAWVIQQPAIASVIVGARTQEQLDNALAARDQPLPTEIIARMNAWLDA